MAPRLLLHIGTEKTGTTAWQVWLAQQRESLDPLGFAVPRTLGPTNHRKLPTSCFDLDRVDDFVIRSGLERAASSERQVVYKGWQHAFAAEVQQREQHTWIVSSEHFSSRLISLSELDRLQAFLKPLFSEIVVHLVVRDPLETAISAWSTLVRSGGYSLEELPPPDHPLLIDRCDHRTIVQRWLRVFPRLQVHIYMHDVVSLLGQSFGLPDCLDSVVQNMPHNPSLSHRAIVEIARLNHQLPVYRGDTLNPEREQRIAEILTEHSGESRFKPSPDQQKQFASHFAESTAWIHRMFFPQREVLFS